MKTIVAFILALGIGFAGAYVMISRQKNAELAPHFATTTEQAAPAAGPKIIVRTVTTGSADESPQDILNDLINVRPGTSAGERNTSLRLVVFKLESLARCGPAGVPAIRAFIGKNVDVDYNQQDAQPDNQNNPQADNGGNNATNNNGGNRGFNRGGGPGNGGFGFRNARRARNLQNLQTDWVVPPSLRLGLVSTLKEIGGSDAEQALGDML